MFCYEEDDKESKRQTDYFGRSRSEFYFYDYLQEISRVRPINPYSLLLINKEEGSRYYNAMVSKAIIHSMNGRLYCVDNGQANVVVLEGSPELFKEPDTYGRKHHLYIYNRSTKQSVWVFLSEGTDTGNSILKDIVSSVRIN